MPELAERFEKLDRTVVRLDAAIAAERGTGRAVVNLAAIRTMKGAREAAWREMQALVAKALGFNSATAL